MSRCESTSHFSSSFLRASPAGEAFWVIPKARRASPRTRLKGSYERAMPLATLAHSFGTLRAISSTLARCVAPMAIHNATQVFTSGLLALGRAFRQASRRRPAHAVRCDAPNTSPPEGPRCERMARHARFWRSMDGAWQSAARVNCHKEVSGLTLFTRESPGASLRAHLAMDKMPASRRMASRARHFGTSLE